MNTRRLINRIARHTAFSLSLLLCISLLGSCSSTRTVRDTQRIDCVQQLSLAEKHTPHKPPVRNTPPLQQMITSDGQLATSSALHKQMHASHVLKMPKLPLKKSSVQVIVLKAAHTHSAAKNSKPLDITGLSFQRILLIALFLFGFYLVWVFVPILFFILMTMVVLFVLIYHEPTQEKRKIKLKKIFRLGLKLTLISLVTSLFSSALFFLLLFFLFSTSIGGTGAFGLALILYPLTLILGTLVVLGLLAFAIGILLLLFAALFRTLYIE